MKENENKDYVRSDKIEKKKKIQPWQILIIILLVVGSLVFSWLSNTIVTLSNNSNDYQTQENNCSRKLQFAKTNVVVEGNQYLSETYFIIFKVEGVENATINDETKEYGYVTFPSSMLPSGAILCYFNSDIKTSTFLRWQQVEDTLQYQLQFVVNNEVKAYNTYYYSNATSEEYRWYITEFNFAGIITPYLSNYQGDIETNYYTAFWSLLTSMNIPLKSDFLNVLENDDVLQSIEYIYSFGGTLSFLSTWQYYQLQTEDEYYQQGYEAGHSNGYNTGHSEGYYDGIGAVHENPEYWDLYTYDDLQEFGNTKYQEGVSSVPSSVDKDGFKWMMGSILNAPYNILSGMLNFEIFGINLFNLISFIFTAVLIMFIVKILLSR